jgi:hypothetical protein
MALGDTMEPPRRNLMLTPITGRRFSKLLAAAVAAVLLFVGKDWAMGMVDAVKTLPQLKTDIEVLKAKDTARDDTMKAIQRDVRDIHRYLLEDKKR